MTSDSDINQSIRVLMVDDDQIFLDTQKHLLQNKGEIEVETVNSVKEAFQILGKKSFDIIVSDYLMPNIDGLQFIKELREQNNLIPFILFSGRGREEVIIQAYNLGVNQYIKKGLDTETMTSEMINSIKNCYNQKQTNISLKQSDEKYNDLADNLPDYIAVLQDGYIKYVNKTLCEKFGWTFNEITSPSFNFMEKIMDISDEKLKEKKFFPYLHNVKTRSGEEIYVLTRTRPMIYQGKPAIEYILQDITDQKKIEKTLIENEEKLRSIIENTSDYIFLVDKNNKVLLINKSAEKFSGKKNSEIVGKTIHNIFPETIGSQFIENIQKVFKTGEELIIESNVMINEKDIWLSTKLTPIKNFEILAVMGISRNITIEKSLEKKKIDTLKQVTAGISHDLRNPLSAINSAVYLLKNPSNEKREEIFSVIEKSISLMSTLLKNFTEFEKEIILNLEKTDINYIIKESLENLILHDNIKVDTKNVLSFQITIDIDKIKRSLYNIIQNSIQAMPKGGTIEITTKRKNNLAEIVIKDTGTGISKKNMDNMFTPFFTTKDGGIGLGLANTKRIIESHKGTIEIKSEINKGTSAIIKLPIK